MKNCKSEKKLSELLLLSYPTEYKKYKKQFLTNEPNKNYKYWTKTQNGKEREFFECKPLTLRIHNRINKLLKINVDTAPSYLKSGIKGMSYIKNAEIHKEKKYFLLVDIKNFYPSITKTKIKSLLIRKYNQSSDVAEFLSNAITVNQKKTNKRALPIGSPLSQNMAFFINRDMFDKLFTLSNYYGIDMSVYVDDVSFSSTSTIPFKFLNGVIHIIKKNGYDIASNKLYYGRLKPKNSNPKSKRKLDITGVHFTKYGVFLTASRNKKIKEKRDAILLKKRNNEKYDKELKSLIASIYQAILLNDKYRRYMKIIKNYF